MLLGVLFVFLLLISSCSPAGAQASASFKGDILMGRHGGSSERIWRLDEIILPLLVIEPPKRVQIMEDGRLLNLRCLLSNAKLLTLEGVELHKPNFLYGD